MTPIEMVENFDRAVRLGNPSVVAYYAKRLIECCTLFSGKDNGHADLTVEFCIGLKDWRSSLTLKQFSEMLSVCRAIALAKKKKSK